MKCWGGSKIGVGVAIGIGIERKLLDRIVVMLTKLGERGYAVHEDPAEYATWLDPDSDSDPDTDTDGEHEQTDRQPLPGGDA